MAKHLAVINDDPLFLALMDALLAREGYEVACYASGAKAYEPVRARPPDAILLDLRMERPDAGLKLLELFKLDPVLSTTPIIVCSADLVQLRTQEAYLKSKGCVVLRKPFELSDLLTLLQQVVGGPG
jgi:two-component system alkaline phosphatase synthesis response regulator PhoP